LTDTATDGRPAAASIASPIHASEADLPPDVAAALADPTPPETTTIDAAGIPFHTLAWGASAAPPLLLLHGITSLAQTWWRIGPAIAAAGFRVIAPDLPGHGHTQHWTGHHRFRDNAVDLVAFAKAAGLDRPDVRIVGHSWGAMTAAAMPAAGLIPGRLVLIDPPAIPVAMISAMLDDPVERAYDDVDEAIAAIGRTYPTWPYGDVVAKAQGLTALDEGAVRAVLTQNGDWDGGLAALADPSAKGVPTWLIRGEVATGGYVPDAVLPAFISRIGADRITTIAGAPHSPHRTHPKATVLAILRSIQG
jgi:pimeloyl-ACP methyl ester carboxylesterase